MPAPGRPSSRIPSPCAQGLRTRPGDGSCGADQGAQKGALAQSGGQKAKVKGSLRSLPLFSPGFTPTCLCPNLPLPRGTPVTLG